MRVANIDNKTGNVASTYWTALEELQQPPTELNQTAVNITELNIDDNNLLDNYCYVNGELIIRPSGIPKYYGFINGTWQDTRSLEDVKAVAKAAMFYKSRESVGQNIEYLGNTYQPNIPLIQDYYINNLSNPNYTVEWLDINNVAHTLSLNDLAQILQMYTAKQEENFQTYQQLKQQINSAQTIAEVEAITWPQ
jgi:hypothetical protein